MKSNSVSVVIVTRNRARDLLQSLGSLLAQTKKPEEVIVIDNASEDETKQLIKLIAPHIVFPVRYIYETKIGYPVIYNRGIIEAKSRWIAFLDDDCVASPFWIETIKNAAGAHAASAAILGQTFPAYPKNIFSLATHIFQQEWKMNNIEKTKIINLEILDNKNIAYNKSFIYSRQLSYDESRTRYLGGAGEDCDFGMQIQLAAGAAIYDKNMIAFHKDPVTPIHYWKKYFFSLAAYEWYKEKWQLEPPLNKTKRIHFRLFALDIAKNYHYTNLQIVLLCIVLYFTIFVSAIINFLVQHMKMRMHFIALISSL